MSRYNEREEGGGEKVGKRDKDRGGIKGDKAAPERRRRSE